MEVLTPVSFRVEANSTEPSSMFNWHRMEQTEGEEGSQVIERMVARDGLEPPTPAFSGPRSTI
jgi:hypothetical protein